MNLNDLLAAKGINPRHVLAMRHRPKERELRKVLPWLAAERPDVFNAYQQAQRPRAESAMARAKYLASFIGHEPGKALFISLYEIGQSRSIAHDDYWRIDANLELQKLGMTGFADDRPSCLWFGLNPTDIYEAWKGKLIVGWPGGERIWCRWADRNEFPIEAILEESVLVPDMPPADDLTLSWEELRVLPKSWKAVLSQWRGVYLIVDVSDGKGYVGSACGTDNLLSRWLSYAASGHGGNKKLRGRAPEGLRFSILKRVSPDMDADDIVRIEGTWKKRLHTREFGLNDN